MTHQTVVGAVVFLWLATSAAAFTQLSKNSLRKDGIIEEETARRQLDDAYSFGGYNLSDVSFSGVTDYLKTLASTPPDEWGTEQIIVAILLLTLVSCCFSCLCCRRRRRGYGGGYPGGYGLSGGYGSSGYYGQAYHGRSCCSRIWNMLMCACCVEWCCRGCQDLPFITGSGGSSNVYYRDGNGEMA